MRIAIVTQGFHSAGGVQSVARWLVEGLTPENDVAVFDLASSSKDDDSRRILSPRTWRRASLLEDTHEVGVTKVGANLVEVEPARYRPRRELTSALSQFDLIQVVAGGPALALAVSQVPRPVVLQVATRVRWERGSRSTHGPILGRLWRDCMTELVSASEPKALTQASAVLVENQEMAGFVRRLGQRRVVIAPPGVDTSVFSPAQTGWSRAGYLLSVCRLNDPRKGLERLLRAYMHIRQDLIGPPKLVIAGRNQLPSSLLRLIASEGLQGCVEVRCDVPQEGLPSLYRGACAYLQASYEEGLGISVLEAMASGLPVIATSTAGTKETILDGQTGWLIEQGPDATVSKEIAARTQDVLSKYGPTFARASRLRAVQDFSSDVTLRRFKHVYASLSHEATKKGIR